MTTSRLVLLAVALIAPPALAQERKDTFGDPLPPGAISRIGTVRLQGSGSLSQVGFNPDGKWLLTTGRGRDLRAWNAATGALGRGIARPAEVDERFKREHPLDVVAFGFTPDGRTIHALTENGTVRAYSVPTGEWAAAPVATGSPGPAYHLGRASPDGTHFVHTIRHDPKKPDGLEVLAVGKPDPVLRVTDVGISVLGAMGGISADNRLVAAMPRDLTIKVWDIGTGKVTAHITAPEGSFSSVALSPDGKAVLGAFGHHDAPAGPARARQLGCWDPTTGKERYRVPNWEGGFPSFSPDGRLFAAHTRNGILLSDAATGRVVRHLAGSERAGGVFGFSPDGKQLASRGESGVLIWDVDSGKAVRDFDGPRGPIHVLALSHDGKMVFVGGRNAATADLWDAGTGKRTHRLDGDAIGGPEAAAFTPDGRHVVVGYAVSGGGKVPGVTWSARVWGVAEGKVVRTMTGFTHGVRHVAVSPDGKELMTRDWEKGVKLWDLDTGKLTREIEWGNRVGRVGLALPRAGEPLGAVHTPRKGVDVANLVTKESLGGVKGDDPAEFLAFSPDGRLAAVKWDRLDKNISVHEIASGRKACVLEGVAAVGNAYPPVFSPDGKRVAVTLRGRAGDDWVVMVFDTATGAKRHTLRGHHGSVGVIAFSADGKRVATGGSDTTVIVWDLTTRP